MADLPSGVDFGTAVHGVLEVFDPTAGDLADAVLAATVDAFTRLPHGDLTPEQLAEALLPTLQTPLGPIADDLTLAEIGRPTGWPSSTSSCRSRVVTVRAPTCGLVTWRPCSARPWPATIRWSATRQLLGHPPLSDETLRGFLTGSIDAVLRVGPTLNPRYLVVDYKTNWLGAAVPVS